MLQRERHRMDQNRRRQITAEAEKQRRSGVDIGSNGLLFQANPEERSARHRDNTDERAILQGVRDLLHSHG